MKVKVKAKYMVKIKGVQFNKEPQESEAFEVKHFYYKRMVAPYYKPLPLTTLGKVFNITT